MTDTTEAITVAETTALARTTDEMSVEQLVERVRKVHHVQREVMKEGVHFGKVPGVDKPTLLKPGAEVLGMTFRLAPDFEISEQVREGDHLTVVVRCKLYHAPTGTLLGSGMGSCSTRESKYAYRKAERTCPQCGQACIIKGKQEYGGGWLCFAKRGGCGAKFRDTDPAITQQVTGRVENPDVYDQHNTVLKMAIKRAHVAAILFVTCASEIFTQDVEDMPFTPAAPREPDQSRKPAPQGRGDAVGPLLEELMYAYSQIRDEGQIREHAALEEQRRKLWPRLSATHKAAAKEAAERAAARMQDPQEPPMREPGDDSWEAAQ